MSPIEVRLRCIEAAAKNPVPHKDGFAAGILEAAKLWEQWVYPQQQGTESSKTLSLPKKGGKVADLL